MQRCSTRDHSHVTSAKYFGHPPPVTVTLPQLISAIVCFWGTPLSSIHCGMSYVNCPQGGRADLHRLVRNPGEPRARGRAVPRADEHDLRLRPAYHLRTKGPFIYEVSSGLHGAGGTPKADDSPDKLRDCDSGRGKKKLKAECEWSRREEPTLIKWRREGGQKIQNFCRLHM